MRYVYGIVGAALDVVYVGKTSVTPQARFGRHLAAVRRDDVRTRHLPIHRWLKKHVDEARVIELECGEWTVNELNAREVAWIAQYGLENLLNISAGGNGGWIDSPGHRAALQAALAKRTPEQRRTSALKALATRRGEKIFVD